MKHITLTTALSLLILLTYGQKTFLDQPYIEVNGSADSLELERLSKNEYAGNY